MKILIHGENKPDIGKEGFVLLRELLVMFIVIICFAAALGAMTVLARQSSRFLENTQLEINQQNEIQLRRVANEAK